MKKLFLLVVLCLFAFSLYADKKSITLSPPKPRPGKSIVQTPTASIDGQVLTIEFSEATASQITVISQGTQVVVYNGSFTNNQIVINLPALSAGEYQLEIEQGDKLYIGEFEIE